MHDSSAAYWARNVPWTFADMKVQPDYHSRRMMRYGLQDYMLGAIGFYRYRGKRVLEIGCGAGIDSAEFALHGAKVTATDSSPLALAETKKLFESERLSGDVKFADAMRLPFPYGSFDLAYSFGVLHHIADVEQALSEIKRVLCKRGEFVSMWYNKDSILYGYSISYLGLSFERVKDAPYAKAYTKQELEMLLSRHFSVESIKAYYNVVDLPGQRKVKLCIPDEHQVGWHLIARCRA